MPDEKFAHRLAGPAAVRRRMRSPALIAAACIGFAAAFAALADDPHGHPEEHGGGHPGPHEDAAHYGHADGHDFHGGRYAFQEHDVRRFNEHDLGLWRAGAWHHEYHNGRYGYWWFAGGAWYFYDQPVYPYPTVVSDSFYVEPEPVVAAPPSSGPLYYCDNPQGYYPTVPRCYSPFRAVTPPPSYAPPQGGYPAPAAQAYPQTPPQQGAYPAPAQGYDPAAPQGGYAPPPAQAYPQQPSQQQNAYPPVN